MKMVLQIKAGFKKTKLGWIPKDWEIGTFESLAQIIMGQSPSGDSYNKENIGVPLLNGPTEFKERYPIKKQWTSRPTKLCVADDILICVRGSSTGRINIANDTYCIGRGVAAIRAHNKNDQTYVEHQLNFAINRILKLTSGSTFPNISSVELKKIKICIPQLKERRVIANCLSNWDKAISSLTSLIDKKTEAKKGLLQQLLSGNKRLDGFSVEWETYRIEEIANDYSVKNERNEEIEVLSCTKYDGLVPSLEYFGRQVFGDDLSKYKMVPRGYFAYATNHIEEGSIGYQDFNNVGLVSPMYTVFKTENSIDDSYFYKVLKSYKLIYEYKRHMEGSIDRRGGLRWKNFKRIKVTIPKKEEQIAIASVLDSADKEIGLLNKQLEQLKIQKKGLMQQLLTGKKRLKV